MKGLFIAATLFCGVLALLTGRAEALGAEMMAAGDAAVVDALWGLYDLVRPAARD